MNDFHNQIDGYTSQNHFSPFHSTFNQSLTDPSENIEGTHPIHHPSKANKQAEGNQRENSKHKTDRTSPPLLFTPPLVVDRVMENKEQKNVLQLNGPSEVKKNHDSKLNHTESSFQIENLLNEEENEHVYGNESSPSSNAESSLYNELEEQFSTMLEESSSRFEEPSSFNEESSPQFEESSSFNEESSSQFEESSSFYEESSPQFEESSSFNEESSPQLEVSSSFNEGSSSQFEESSSFCEESSPQFEESSSFYEESSLMESSSGQNEIMESTFEVPSLERTLPIVKIPVLLANLEFDIDLFDAFPIEIPIENISKIDWHVHSFDCNVLLPSPNVFLKGLLVANLTYVNNNKSSSLHSMKIKIPFDKVKKMDWFYPPELSSSHQAEYMYRGNEEMDVHFHREFSQKFAEPIQTELQNVYIIWHDELISNGSLRELDIQGKVQLSMTLLQSQYVDLDDLHG